MKKTRVAVSGHATDSITSSGAAGDGMETLPTDALPMSVFWCSRHTFYSSS